MFMIVYLLLALSEPDVDKINKLPECDSPIALESAVHSLNYNWSNIFPFTNDVLLNPNNWKIQLNYVSEMDSNESSKFCLAILKHGVII